MINLSSTGILAVVFFSHFFSNVNDDYTTILKLDESMCVFLLSQLLKRREVSVPLKIEQLSVELDAWRASTQVNAT